MHLEWLPLFEAEDSKTRKILNISTTPPKKLSSIRPLSISTSCNIVEYNVEQGGQRNPTLLFTFENERKVSSTSLNLIQHSGQKRLTGRIQQHSPKFNGNV